MRLRRARACRADARLAAGCDQAPASTRRPALCPAPTLRRAAGPEGRRTAVVVFKEKATPSQYPRKPGVPSKKPL